MAKRKSEMAAPSVDRDWEAEDDARTLMRACEVQKDSKRLTRAQKALKKLEAEAKETLLKAKVVKGMKAAFPKGEEY